MSWAPEDDEPTTPRKLLSRGMCHCDMCNEDPAQDTELDVEDIE